ncbi:MAG: uroporphyrinogen-III synthase [Limnochordaceae bacterium]|nr:uroporphyrinogen-III synthase [Limnochordaceae bacterium]
MRLSGCRVLVTRPAHQAGPTVAALEAEGARVISVPVLRIAPPDDPEALRRASREAWEGRFDWVVVTSPNGAHALAEALRAVARGRGAAAAGEQAAPAGGALGQLPARVCAVGAATRRALEAAHVRVDCMPDEPRAAAIPAALARCGHLQGARILLAVGDRADEVLQRELAAGGATVVRVEAYRTLDVPANAARAAALVRSGGVDVLVAASPSAVHAVTAHLNGPPPGRVRVVAIGPTTADAALGAGWRVEQATSPSPEALAAACARAWQELRMEGDGQGR